MFNTLIKKEIRESIFENKGLWLTSASAVILSVLCFIVCNIKEGAVLSQADILQYAIKAAFLVMLLVVCVLASSSFVSEREENTLESLLLTPVTNRRLALAKYLAVNLVGLVLLLVSVPYIVAIASGSGATAQAILLLLLCGILLMTAFSALSTAMSIRMRNSKSSVLISVLIIAALTLPSLAQGLLKLSAVGRFILKIDPVVACFNLMSKVITDKMSIASQLGYFIPLICFTALAVVIMLAVSKSISLKGEK